MSKKRSMTTGIGWRTLALVAIAVTMAFEASIADAGEPPNLLPYSVIRTPHNTYSSSRTSLQKHRHATPVVPRQRQPYAYGWFGASSNPRVERQHGYNNLRRVWSWK